jgi:competence protein ComEC
MLEARKAILLSVFGFIAGVAVSSFFNFDFRFAALFIFLAVVFFAILLLRGKRNVLIFFTAAVLFFGFGLGILRYEIKDQRDYSLENFVGKEINFKGVIIDEPDEREDGARLVVKVDFFQNQNFPEAETKILIYSRHYPKFKYGDLISIKGKLRKPKKITLAGRPSKTFNWPAYLAKNDIFYEVFYPEISFVSGGHGSWIKRRLFILKENFLDNLTKVISEPAVSFLGGITVGAKKSIPKGLRDDFIATGIIHVVVLSGYNVVIISRAIMLFFEIFVPRLIALMFGALGIIFFAVMTGGAPSVVRASVMAIFVLLARRIGRIYHVTSALFAAGFLMVAHNPKILRFDISFQLSFIATLGLIYLAPYFENFLKFLPKKLKLRETAAATLSAQLSVSPLILYTMGNFSVVALPVNLLILPLIPATMFFGFLTGGLGLISNFLSVPFGWISYGFLAFELWIIKIFASFSFASIKISYFPAIAVILIYGTAVGSVVLFRTKRKISD